MKFYLTDNLIEAIYKHDLSKLTHLILNRNSHQQLIAENISRDHQNGVYNRRIKTFLNLEIVICEDLKQDFLLGKNLNE